VRHGPARTASALVLCCAAVTAAWADGDAKPRPIVGFRVEGKSKVTERTLGYLAHVELGESVGPGDVGRIEVALISSELFETALVRFEDAPGGVVLVATLDDKMSWFAAPTIYVLPTNRAVGAGYVQNDLGGRDQKLLLYGQLGTQTSLLFGTFLDPAYHGSKLTYRFDLYLERRGIDEYENPANDSTSKAIARSTRQVFIDAGALIGWTFKWWLVADLRLRGAYVYFRGTHDASGATVPAPEKDGWDVTAQMRLTLDHRIHRFGVTWGPYVQAELEPSVPGFDSYGYASSLLRAYYSWRLFCEHEFEVRGVASAGYHMPLHEEYALGGVSDLRGYPTDQFRGDVNTLLRAEYSVPIAKYKIFAFRALGFYDGGYSGFHNRRTSDRDYLPIQLQPGVYRNDVGAGFRVYVKSVVLPLLGFDIGYGIEGKSPEVYFEVGLTDF
jgi:outer membrane protein insertion porin family